MDDKAILMHGKLVRVNIKSRHLKDKLSYRRHNQKYLWIRIEVTLATTVQPPQISKYYY